MPNKSIGTLRNASNADIANAIRINASPDYQRRVPEATQENLASQLAALDSARPLMNEFVDILINRIGSTVVQSKVWTNPLAQFKKGKLGAGETMREIMFGLLDAYTYQPERDYGEEMLFKTERPDVDASYHHITRQEFYKISVNEDILRRAFIDGGLSEFVQKIMDAPATSDAWDEFSQMCALFSLYEENGGFYHMHVDPFDQAGADDLDVAKDALRKMRTLADNMTFLSTKYNAAKMPTFAKPEDLILFTTPEFKNALDVEAFASLFGPEYAQAPGKVITLPQANFGVEGCQGILTTKDFFVVADTLVENTSQWNPVSLSTNYFFHHHEIISASRFVPAVMIWNGQDDEKVKVLSPATALTVDVKDASGASVTTYEPNRLYDVEVTADVNPHSGSVKVELDSPVSDERTMVKNGILRVGPNESGSLTVKASLYSGEDQVVGTKALTKSESATAEYDRWPGLKA